MYTRPTILSRVLLAVYSAVVGYITFGLLLALLGYDVISKGSVILHFKIDATAVIPGFFLAGLFVLPRFLASNEFRPLRKFFGGALTQFLATIFTTLFLMGTYIFATFNNPELAPELSQDFLPETFEDFTKVVAYFLGVGSILGIALSPIGGFAAWIAYLFIYRKFQRGKFE
ncbi:hypothetical protein [Kiloniella sp.]|uniref:hypothetical protein n=1 Tax=Kiloniella sp. TaxID=1938587 RepID=UPI003B018A15